MRLLAFRPVLSLFLRAVRVSYLLPEMQEGDQVWVRHDSEVWARGSIATKSESGDFVVEVKLVNGEVQTHVATGFTETDSLKLCNVKKKDSVLDTINAASAGQAAAAEEDDSHNDVDDLIQLMHLHEPGTFALSAAQIRPD